MNTADLRTRLEQLRPRDRDVVRVLVLRTDLDLQEAAAHIGMSLHNLKERLQRIFLVLGLSVRTRLHLVGVCQAVVRGCTCPA